MDDDVYRICFIYDGIRQKYQSVATDDLVLMLYWLVVSAWSCIFLWRIGSKKVSSDHNDASELLPLVKLFS